MVFRQLAPAGHDGHIRGSTIVLEAGDDPRHSNLAHQCRRLAMPCVLGVE